MPDGVQSVTNAKEEWLQKPLYVLLETASVKMTKVVEDDLQRLHGIVPRHYLALSVLEELKEPINQQELADVIKMHRNMMVQLMDQMESLQLAERKAKATNRREHVILITSKGRKVLAQAQKTVRAAEEKCLHGMSAGDRKILGEWLRKICREGKNNNKVT
jgi:DNA phosphorothioation-dependent restriction protein DptG